jgi:Rrf2 family protein
MMVDIARNGTADEPVSLGAVSDRTSISRSYLEHVAHALRTASLLRSVSGRRGGYWLAESPDSITIGQIFDALNGPTRLVDCVDDAESCSRRNHCECAVVYKLINDRIVEVLEGHTLADLLDPAWVREQGGAYLNDAPTADTRRYKTQPPTG